MVEPVPNCPEPVVVIPPPLAAPDPQDLRPFVVRNFALRRGLEGPQIIITWEAPEDAPAVTAIKLVRRFFSYPGTPDDGLLLFEGPPDGGRYTDLDLPACQCAYYKIFSQLEETGAWVSLPRAEGAIVPIETGFFAGTIPAGDEDGKGKGKMWDMLPEVYVIGDKKQGEVQTGKITLEPKVVDPDTGEVFNLYEDGLELKGELRRYMKLLGADLDHAKGLIDCLPNQYDVDEACAQFLPFIADLLGVNLNRELSVLAQREEIKKAVEIYKIKGTKPGLEALLRSITGMAVEVVDFCKNILISNCEDRTSMPLLSQGRGFDVGLPGDDLAYTIDSSPTGRYSWKRWAAFIQIPCGECLPRWVVEKIARVLPDYQDACSIGFICFLDCHYVETYDGAGVGESSTNCVEGSDTENIFDLCWLIANEEERVSNSTSWLTAFPGTGICAEFFHDIIQHQQQDADVEDLRDCVLISNEIDRLSNDQHWLVAGLNPHVCVTDSFRDEIVRLPFTEHVVGACWLLANEEERVSNSIAWLVAGGDRQTSICGEFFRDEIESHSAPICTITLSQTPGSSTVVVDFTIDDVDSDADDVTYSLSFRVVSSGPLFGSPLVDAGGSDPQADTVLAANLPISRSFNWETSPIVDTTALVEVKISLSDNSAFGPLAGECLAQFLVDNLPILEITGP